MHVPLYANYAVCAVGILSAACAPQPDAPTTSDPTPAMTQPLPPAAPTRAHVVHSPHGDRIDEYYWLRDDERTDADVLAWLAAENAYRSAQMAHLAGLEQSLYDELVGRMQKDESTVPAASRGYYYYERYEPDGEYPIYARRKGSPRAPEEVILDVGALADGYDYYDIGDSEVSPDNRLLAYTEDTVGRGIYTVRVRDLDTGRTLPDQMPGSTAAIAWANDNRTLFYIERDPVTLLGYRVRRHRLGEPVTADTIAYEETDNTFYLSIGRTGDDRFVVIELSNTVSDELRYLPADTPDGAFRVLIPRERGHEYDADHGAGRWIIRTNRQAENFRIVTAADSRAADIATWQELVPHDRDVYIADFDVFNDFIAIAERRNALRSLRVLALDGSADYPVASDEVASVMDIDENPEPATDWLRYSYSSLKTPETIYELNMRTRERRLLKQDVVLGGFDATNYRTERLWAPARDGARIPVTIVYRDGFTRDGSAPLYQYGYGAYGFSTDPGFDGGIVSLLDRGFVYAIAHVRGGQELGRSWYEDGRLLHKRNTFTDFIDVSEFLVAGRYANPEKIVAAGGSAGGLLIGAVTNMRPELYRVVIADVPFVDVVTTMLDESIPLTTGEFDEWGNPAREPYYDYMLSYSPYDNVTEQDYPAMLVMTGLWDSAVQYFEPAKWVARLRARKTDNRPLLLHINMDAGHGGQSGRYRANRELAMQYAFIFDEIGLTAP